MRKKYRNPKLVGSNLIDCKPQVGACPMNCNQCFYNRPGASFVPLDKTHIPTKKEAEGKIVRMNSLHDSNIKRTLVLRAAKKYKHVFFNTSIPQFDELPGPIVYTANPREEEPVDMRFLRAKGAEKLAFVRLRTSITNLKHVANAIRITHDYGTQIPVVLTFMAYYDYEPNRCFKLAGEDSVLCYTWRKRHINEYWCPTRGFRKYVLDRMRKAVGRQVTMCGTLDSNYCRDCHNCEAYYWQTYRRLQEIKEIKT